MYKCNLGSATIDLIKNQSDLHKVGCADRYTQQLTKINKNFDTFVLQLLQLQLQLQYFIQEKENKKKIKL